MKTHLIRNGFVAGLLCVSVFIGGAALAAGQVSGITVNQVSVVGGDPVTGTVSLVSPGPAEGAVVLLDMGSATVGDSGRVTIPPGQLNAPYSLLTKPRTNLILEAHVAGKTEGSDALTPKAAILISTPLA